MHSLLTIKSFLISSGPSDSSRSALALFFCLICTLSGTLIITSCTHNAGPRMPMHGVELSTCEGIHITRNSRSSNSGTGTGSFALNQLEAHGLDAVSLIDLVAPNCRVRVHGKTPAGRYNITVDSDAFPAQSTIQQRLLIQQSVYRELERIFHLTITHDRAKKQVIISN